MKKIFYLKTCDTCKKILNQIPNLEQFEIQDLKTSPITQEQLELLRSLTTSYESLVNKRAQLYKSRALKDQNLTEQQFKDLILEHYTFLSRPVVVLEDQIFIGNSKKNVTELLSALL